MIDLQIFSFMDPEVFWKFEKDMKNDANRLNLNQISLPKTQTKKRMCLHANHGNRTTIEWIRRNEVFL